MKKILIVDTTWPINSRTERFKNSFKKCFEVVVSAWNRGAKNGKDIDNDTYLLEHEIGYGNQIKKLLKLPLFILHNYRVCKTQKPDIIFASHWDSLICAVILKLVWNWKLKIVYDCLDLPTFSNSLVRIVITAIERICLNFVSLTIFASRYFVLLYSNKLKYCIFENYPSISLLGSSSEEPSWVKGYDKKIFNSNQNVAWIGVVRYFNIINNILLAICNTDIKFFIFGDGPDLDKVKRTVEKYALNDQVFFFGRYEASDLRWIYEHSGLIWAAYPTNDCNAVYAISNKYFECSFFEKKIILSKKTKMAEKLGSCDEVVLVDEYSVGDIKDKILLNITQTSCDNYHKYENDVSWESQEERFIQNLIQNKII